MTGAECAINVEEPVVYRPNQDDADQLASSGNRSPASVEAPDSRDPATDRADKAGPRSDKISSGHLLLPPGARGLSSSGECTSNGSLTERSAAPHAGGSGGSGSPGRTNGGATTTEGTKQTHESEHTVHRGALAGDNGATGSSAQGLSNGDGSDGKGSSPRGATNHTAHASHNQPGARDGPFAVPVAKAKEQQQTSSKADDAGRVKPSAAAACDRPKLPRPDGHVNCPRCASDDTKFCYYNNYNINQPRYFCKACQRYWTAGGTLRNVPVGSGRRKNKNGSKRCDSGVSTDLQSSGSAAVTGSCGMTTARAASGMLPDMISPYHFQPGMLIDPALAAYAGAALPAIGGVNPTAMAGVSPLQVTAEQLRHMSGVGMSMISAQPTMSGLHSGISGSLGFTQMAAAVTGQQQQQPSIDTTGGARSNAATSTFFKAPGGAAALDGNSGDGSNEQQGSEDGSIAGRRVRARTVERSGSAGAEAGGSADASGGEGEADDTFAVPRAAAQQAAAAGKPVDGSEQQQQPITVSASGFQPTGAPGADPSSLSKLSHQPGMAGAGNPMEWLSYAAVANQQQQFAALQAAQAAQLQAAAAVGWGNAGAQNPYMSAGLGWPYHMYANNAQQWAAYARMAPAGAWMDPNAAAAVAAAASAQQQQPQQQGMPNGGAGNGPTGPSQQQMQAAQQQAQAVQQQQQQAVVVAQQQQQAVAVAQAQAQHHAMLQQQQQDDGAAAMAASNGMAGVNPGQAPTCSQAMVWPGAWPGALAGPAPGMGWGAWGAMPTPGMGQGGQLQCMLPTGKVVGGGMGMEAGAGMAAMAAGQVQQQGGGGQAGADNSTAAGGAKQ